MSFASDLRLTNADMEAMPDDGNRYEVIDGEMYVSPPPSFHHQTILVNVAFAFGSYLRHHPIGRITPGVGVIFDDYNGVTPDLVFATHEKMHRSMVGGRFRSAPEIVIEILSPGSTNERRDRHVKHNLYAARGVGEYWLIDPENRSVEIHRRDEAGNLLFHKTLQHSDEITSAFLPGFRVPAEAFFA